MKEKERRRYYRINDKVSLRYKILEHSEYDDEVHDARSGLYQAQRPQTCLTLY